MHKGESVMFPVHSVQLSAAGLIACHFAAPIVVRLIFKHSDLIITS